MTQQDYYELLEIERTAGAGDIKVAYRKLAMKYHPDRNPGCDVSEKKFKDISQAYEILKDEQKRAAYDQYGHAAFENGGGGRRQSGGFSGFSDIFEEMFSDVMGGNRQRQASFKGADLKYNLEITLEEAFKGLDKIIHVPTKVGCKPCNGSGSAGEQSAVSCSSCNGHGKVRSQQGFFTIERTCPTCHGSGQVVKDPCKKCHGQGIVHGEKNLNVNIPAGVEDGMRIRVTGEGEAGLRGHASGDLYLFISVKEHELFYRERENLFCRVPVPMTIAVLGGNIEVPTIEGKKANVNVPHGTQNGHRLRLKQKGMPVLRNAHRGHMVVELYIEIPVKLTKKQKELLEEFQEEAKSTEGQSPKTEGFLSRLKEFWDDLTDT